jgi:prepilin-type N-terminal cleavage/methylation domain-containing protein
MNRRGFTLIETMIAMTMLLIVVTTFARYMAQFHQGTTRSTALTIASAVAKDRLEMIRADPRYFTLTTLYGTGPTSDTTGFPGYATMKRVTTMVRDQSGTPARDRTTVTLRVTWPGMPDTVRLTTVRSRP